MICRCLRHPCGGGSNLSQDISYPHEELPAAGTTTAVAPGIEWLRMPLPFALDHINLWLLEDGAGWTAVDTGIALEPVMDAWKSALAGRRLRRQIVTHFHPDHLGLAAWLEQETGAPLAMTLGEYTVAQLVAHQVPPYDLASMVGFFRLHGLDAERIAALQRRGNVYRSGVPAIPASYRRLIDGDVLAIGGRDWRVITGYGHAPEHASLYCDALRVLISGDMLLPRISTNVSAFASSPDCDALGLFLASIKALKALPADTLVLPSHGRPFRGLHARVDELVTHHAARCEDLLGACATPQSAAELIPVLFPREISDAHQTMFAMGEAIAHLTHLEQARPAPRLERVTENGIVRFRKVHQE
ncbi:glyoxylase-like metal-dependent hydrolase (beta-lactamase superfamily II) [Sulfurisoma sediminicola]|uniref:Glyoxylase-like metal-dependent hydrolase (Beta-lactamase superfamily II) n=1 Tax=Sulfurisoma sediminicola TaxID=1381557 RepID=A0A497XJI6_9PROT|nr:glyoxylase-like metal-dependent hydrolase (beta-lactamase superfamily II) [Sulfurisoma sediminicola]